MTIQNKIPSAISDDDWKYAFQCCGAGESEDSVYNDPHVSVAINGETHNKPFQRKNVKRVLYLRDGENDVFNWLGVFELYDGRFAFLSAGCDYTGWSCQSSGYAIVSHSLEHLWQFGIGEDDRYALEGAVIKDIVE